MYLPYAPHTEAIDKATSPHQPPHPVPSFPQQMLAFSLPVTPSLSASSLYSYVCPLRQFVFEKLSLYHTLYIPYQSVPDPCWTRLAADNRSPDPQAPGMPPRNSLTSSFSASDANNEVVCPLRNHDGSSCRKRCLGVSTDKS